MLLGRKPCNAFRTWLAWTQGCDKHDTCRVHGREDFHTVMPAPALLGKDAAYWQSVHQAGQGLLKERQEAAKKEKDAWQAKVQRPDEYMSTLICL